MKVLSVHFARTRKPEYSTRTEIVKFDDKIIVRKVAMTDKAVPFVNGMDLNYRRMVEMYGKEHVAEGWLEKDGIFCMEFIDGISMEKQAMDYFVQGNYDGFIDVISYWYHNILPDEIAEKTGSQYINPLDENRKYNLDLALSNIIMPKNGQFKIVDYEWLFPTGSKQLIGSRIMKEFYYQHSRCFAAVKMTMDDLISGIGVDQNVYGMLNEKIRQFYSVVVQNDNGDMEKKSIAVKF